MHSNISTYSMEINWRDPSQHDNLVQRYVLEISETNGNFAVNKSVDRQNEYQVNSGFVPGHLFTVTITSVVFLNDVGKTVYIKSNLLHLVVGKFILFIINNKAFLFFCEFSWKLTANLQYIYRLIYFIVEPLSPGAINISGSIFHPEHLHLNWAVPAMNTSVDMYRITIDGHSFNSSRNFIDWPKRLEPGTKYNVTIHAISCWNLIYEKRSEPYDEEITTIRT